MNYPVCGYAHLLKPASLFGAHLFPLPLPGRVNPPPGLHEPVPLLGPLGRTLGLPDVRRYAVGSLTRR